MGAMAEALHYICPTCGSDVEVGKPCPGCPKPRDKRRPKQKQAARSWEQDGACDGLDLPDDEDFDYEEFTRREFGRHPAAKTGLRRRWWWLAAILLALMILGLAAVVPFWFRGEW